MANVVIGSGKEIAEFLFGKLPSEREMAAKRLRQAWSSRRKVQGIAKAFGIPARLEINNRAVRQAIKELRETEA